MDRLPLLSTTGSTLRRRTSLVRLRRVHGLTHRWLTTHGLSVRVIGGVASSATTSTAASTTAASERLVSLSWGTVTVSGYVRGRPLLLSIVKLLVECNSLTVIQRFEAVLLDLRVMDENIFRTIGRGDEAEALVAEELDGSLK